MFAAGVLAAFAHEEPDAPLAASTTTTTSSPDEASSSSTTVAAPASTPSTATTAAPATTGPTSTSTTPEAVPAPGPPPVVPGVYTYDQSGEVRALGMNRELPPETATRYHPPEGTDQRSNVEDGELGSGEEIRRRGPDGVYLVRITLTGPEGDITLEPDPPALFAPWPLEPGHEWSWSDTLSDGSATVSQRSKTVSVERLTIGGVAVDTVVIDTTIDITGDGLDVRQQLRSWISPRHGLAVKTDSTISGTYNGIPIEGETATLLRSLTPT